MVGTLSSRAHLYDNLIIDANNLAWRMYFVYDKQYDDHKILRGLIRMFGLLKKNMPATRFHFVLDGGSQKA